jgi:anti-sigma regulatory factor (Ser/Thr protein kinase)
MADVPALEFRLRGNSWMPDAKLQTPFVQVSLTNQPGEKQKLLQALQEFARDHRLTKKVLQAADLALEEHLTNVMKYGYDDAQVHEILVRLEMVNGEFQIEVEDDGKAFNPLDYPGPDLNLPLSERPIGGLGIHLIRKFMDELAYRREGGRNVLQMRKKVTSSE